MNVRTPLLVSLLLIAVLAAVTVWGWMAVPAGAKIAVHWGIDGQPNGWTGKSGLLWVPAMAAGVTALFWLLPRIAPRARNLAASRSLYVTAWLGVLALLVLVQALIVLSAQGRHLDIGGAVMAAMAALLLIATGNFLGKTRPNFFAGMRTPWSLSSDLAWEKSNRAAGRLFVLTGLVMLAALLIAGVLAATIALLVGLIGGTIVSIVLSYIYWRRDPNRHSTDFTPE
jgi:uncharacterized membrane protein